MTLPKTKLVGQFRRGEYIVIGEHILRVANNLGYDKARNVHFLEIEAEDGRVYTYKSDPLDRYRNPIEGAEWVRKQIRDEEAKKQRNRRKRRR
jgi:hypothetical protein